MQEANRLKRLPLYLFTIIDELKKRAREKGVDVIDFGMGSPDIPSPPHVIEALRKAYGFTVEESIADERGKLVDLLARIEPSPHPSPAGPGEGGMS
jgi:aspartate/methionine/tyrosine aminotransferase